MCAQLFFYLFAGYDVPLARGWQDFKASTYTIEQAEAIIKKEKYSWWQIFDVPSMQLVKEHLS